MLQRQKLDALLVKPSLTIIRGESSELSSSTGSIEIRKVFCYRSSCQLPYISPAFSCCGTHLPSIHNLQLFLIPHTEALSRASTTTARLYFLAGPRLITYLTSTQSIVAQATSTLSCGPPLVPERLTQVVEERKRADKRVGDLEGELAEHIARSLLDQSSKITTPEESTKCAASHLHRIDDGTNALSFLSSIASSIANQAGQHLGGRPYLFVLSSSPSTQTQTSSSTVLVIGSDEKSVKQVGDALKAKLGIKGGGKGPRWSGKWTGVWKATKENAVIAEVLNDVQK